jgi:hypothetical protein
MNMLMNMLKDELKLLKDNHSLVGIKGGTEVEAMTFEEIYFMHEISKNIVPLTVKIGGPEARNDIDFILTLGVERILAPMIESAYGLKNFINTIDEMDKQKSASLAVNIETITAYNNLEGIIRSPHFTRLDQITVGRSDLAASMNRDVDDEKVMTYSKEIIDQIKFYGKMSSVGGKINPVNAKLVKENLNPDCINTRHMVINCNSNDIEADTEAALLWEKKYYQYLMKHFPTRNDFYKERITSIISRLNQKIMI